MAIYQSSGIVTAISGTLNSSVFRNGPNSKVIARSPHKTDRQTDDQLRVRSWLALCARLWAGQDLPSRLAWETSARTYSTVNRVGSQRPKRGRELFALWFWDQVAKNFDVPPAAAGRPYMAFTIAEWPILLSLDFATGAPGYYKIKTWLTPTYNWAEEVWCARLLPHPETQPRTWRRMGTLLRDSPEIDAWSLFTGPTNNWEFAVGENVAVRVRWHHPLDIWPGIERTAFTTVY
jgi:hypothetical protein